MIQGSVDRKEGGGEGGEGETLSGATGRERQGWGNREGRSSGKGLEWGGGDVEG